MSQPTPVGPSLRRRATLPTGTAAPCYLPAPPHPAPYRRRRAPRPAGADEPRAHRILLASRPIGAASPRALPAPSCPAPTRAAASSANLLRTAGGPAPPSPTSCSPPPPSQSTTPRHLPSSRAPPAALTSCVTPVSRKAVGQSPASPRPSDPNPRPPTSLCLHVLCRHRGAILQPSPLLHSGACYKGFNASFVSWSPHTVVVRVHTCSPDALFSFNFAFIRTWSRMGSMTVQLQIVESSTGRITQFSHEICISDL
jgi:hypothetical protein